VAAVPCLSSIDSSAVFQDSNSSALRARTVVSEASSACECGCAGVAAPLRRQDPFLGGLEVADVQPEGVALPAKRGVTKAAVGTPSGALATMGGAGGQTLLRDLLGCVIWKQPARSATVPLGTLPCSSA
jgi:hypothetical protein